MKIIKWLAPGLTGTAFILTIIFWLSNITTAHDLPLLITTLNIIFITVAPVFISVIAAQSFLRTGSWTFAWIGIGALSFGIAVGLSSIFVEFINRNVGITVHNSISLFASFLFFLAAFYNFQFQSIRGNNLKRLYVFLGIYIISLLFISILIILSIYHTLPLFFIEGRGGTPIRNTVLTVTTILFLISGIMFLRQYLRSRSQIFFWCSFGLISIALGIVGLTLQSALGTPLNWVGRVSEIFGGIYLFIAAMITIKEAKLKKLPVWEEFSYLFGENEANFKLLFQNMSEAFMLGEVITNTKGEPINYKFLEVNNSFENLMGKQRKEIIGKTVLDVFPDTEPFLIEAKGKVAITGKSIHSERFIPDTKMWTEIFAYSPKRNQVAVIYTDITVRKKVEEELKLSNKELEAFNYSVSHDLRGPLRSIDGYAKILMDENFGMLSISSREYLSNIRSSSAKLANILDDMQRLFKITTSEFNLKNVNLSAIVMSISDELKYSQHNRNVEFLIGNNIMASCDETLLKIALTNLIENSWKFTVINEKARIEFGIKVINNKKVYFIKDNGLGFDEKYSGKIFEPFNRLHNNKDIPGTGVGLSIVERVIKKHNGNIWAKSNPGVETIFYFTLNI